MLCRKEKCSDWFTIIGAFLLAVPIGFQWYWGNIATYVYSYTIKHHPDFHDINSPWILSLYFVGMNVSQLMTGMISVRTGKRLMAVFGMAMFNGGLISSYFVVQSQPVLLNVTLGMAMGIGCGVLFTCGLSFTIESATKHVDILTSVFLTSFILGAILVNQVASYYVNPLNKIPDIFRDSSKFFSYNGISDKVPRVFLLIAIITFASQIIGLGMVVIGRLFRRDSDNKSSSSDVQGDLDALNENRTLVEHNESPANVQKHYKSRFNYSVKDLVRCKYFYALSFALSMREYANVVIMTYYKSFGLANVGDDLFYANMSVLMTVYSAVARVCCGFVIDKFGAKPIIISLSLILSLGFAFVFFTALIDKWLYAVTAGSLIAILCAQFSSFVIAAVSLFGTQQASANVGLMMLSGIVSDFVSPQVIKFLLHSWGWFSLFSTSSVALVLNVVVFTYCLPDF